LKSALYKQKQSNKPKDEPYAGFKVDEKPLTGVELIKENPDNLGYNQNVKTPSFIEINNNHIQSLGKPIKTINRKSDIAYKGDCPYCQAPNDYLYNNNNGNQCKCKACNNTFSYKTKFYDENSYYCPHCKSKLMMHHDRENYLVYKCQSDICSYYQSSLKKQETGDKSLKTVTNTDKLRYTYRAFKFDFNHVNNQDKLQFDTKISLDKAHHSPETIGKILTLYINYGLSSRKVSMIMKDLFNISISHQTVMNYAQASASLLQNFVINYNYNLGNILCGDETYVDVLGKSHYVFFFSDHVKKIITSWKIYKNRDTKCAVESILMSLHRYHNNIPEDLLVITDANPIYNAAQIFYQ
jgi:hypothetical protein